MALGKFLPVNFIHSFRMKCYSKKCKEFRRIVPAKFRVEALSGRGPDPSKTDGQTRASCDDGRMSARPSAVTQTTAK